MYNDIMGIYTHIPSREGDKNVYTHFITTTHYYYDVKLLKNWPHRGDHFALKKSKYNYLHQKFYAINPSKPQQVIQTPPPIFSLSNEIIGEGAYLPCIEGHCKGQLAQKSFQIG